MRSLIVAAALIATPAVAQIPDRAVCGAPPASSAAQPTVIPIEVSFDNHVFVKVCAGDLPLDFILDTGASMNFFDLRTAERLGLKLGDSMIGTGAGPGSIAGAWLEGASVRFPGSSLTQSVSGALDFSRMGRGSGRRVGGMLGYEFIRRFVVAIDYVKHELRLYDARTFHYEGSGAPIPLIFLDNQPHVMAEVRLADGGTVKGRMVVDVGSGGALLLTKPFADENRLRERIGRTLHRRTGAGVGGPVTSDVGRVETLSMGRVEVSRPVTSLAGASAGNFSGNDKWIGNIGGDILRRYTVFFDYANKRMILEPHAGTSEPYEADMSGLSLVMNDNLTSALVDYVVPGSPATDAGLAVGDTLVSIDGQPTTAVAVRDLRKRFRRDGERIVLTVRRGGKTRTVTLVLRRLV